MKACCGLINTCFVDLGLSRYRVKDQKTSRIIGTLGALVNKEVNAEDTLNVRGIYVAIE